MLFMSELQGETVITRAGAHTHTLELFGQAPPRRLSRNHGRTPSVCPTRSQRHTPPTQSQPQPHSHKQTKKRTGSTTSKPTPHSTPPQPTRARAHTHSHSHTHTQHNTHTHKQTNKQQTNKQTNINKQQKGWQWMACSGWVSTRARDMLGISRDMPGIFATYAEHGWAAKTGAKRIQIC